MNQFVSLSGRNNRTKGIMLLFLVCMAFMVFAMGIVRGKCITKGYELSRMVGTLESMRIDMEKIEADRSVIVSKEQLYPVAYRYGFIFRQEGKTFNVQ
jgi:hypothetical protein